MVCKFAAKNLVKVHKIQKKYPMQSVAYLKNPFTFVFSLSVLLHADIPGLLCMEP